MKPTKQVTKQMLEDLISQGLNAREISDELGIPTSKVKEGVKFFKINLRKTPRTIVQFVKEKDIIKPDKEQVAPVLSPELKQHFEELKKQTAKVAQEIQDLKIEEWAA